jgi:uncharacterized protein with von Willebrand factor type A (vWA) domain
MSSAHLVTVVDGILNNPMPSELHHHHHLHLLTPRFRHGWFSPRRPKIQPHIVDEFVLLSSTLHGICFQHGNKKLAQT